MCNVLQFLAVAGNPAVPYIIQFYLHRCTVFAQQQQQQQSSLNPLKCSEICELIFFDDSHSLRFWFVCKRTHNPLFQFCQAEIDNTIQTKMLYNSEIVWHVVEFHIRLIMEFYSNSFIIFVTCKKHYFATKIFQFRWDSSHITIMGQPFFTRSQEK